MNVVPVAFARSAIALPTDNTAEDVAVTIDVSCSFFGIQTL
jgi:hypothetical protein